MEEGGREMEEGGGEMKEGGGEMEEGTHKLMIFLPRSLLSTAALSNSASLFLCLSLPLPLSSFSAFSPSLLLPLSLLLVMLQKDRGERKREVKHFILFFNNEEKFTRREIDNVFKHVMQHETCITKCIFISQITKPPNSKTHGVWLFHRACDA